MQTVNTGDYIIRKHGDGNYDRMFLNTPGEVFQALRPEDVTPELEALFRPRHEGTAGK